MSIFNRARLLGGAAALAIAFCTGSSQAAIVTMNFSGATISAIADNTDYFGLGNSIASGTPYALSLQYDEALGHVVQNSTVPCGSGCNATIKAWNSSSDSSSPDFSPPHVTNVQLAMNGTALNINPATFTFYTIATLISNSLGSNKNFCPSGTGVGTNPVCTFTNATEFQSAALNGGSAAGDSLALNFSHNLIKNSVTGPGVNQLNLSETLVGSLAFMLLDNAGAPLVDISALEAFALTPLDGGTDVPLPAALPMMVAGIAGLGGMGTLRRKMALPL